MAAIHGDILEHDGRESDEALAEGDARHRVARMADTPLRTPFFLAALLCSATVLLLDGASAWLAGWIAPFTTRFAPGIHSPPGIGIPTLALVDWLLFVTLLLMASPLVVPARIHAKAQGVVTFLVGFSTIFAGIAAAFMALAKMLLMIVIMLAFPFGTIIYLIMFGHFNRSGAAAILALAWTFKLACAVLLVLSHQRMIANKGLILILATSLVMGVVVGFLHALPPGFLVSITDAIAAIVAGIVGAIWGLILAIGAIPAVIKVLRVDKGL
jgi:hypothetical protein